MFGLWQPEPTSEAWDILSKTCSNEAFSTSCSAGQDGKKVEWSYMLGPSDSGEGARTEELASGWKKGLLSWCSLSQQARARARSSARTLTNGGVHRRRKLQQSRHVFDLRALDRFITLLYPVAASFMLWQRLLAGDLLQSSTCLPTSDDARDLDCSPPKTMGSR